MFSNKFNKFLYTTSLKPSNFYSRTSKFSLLNKTNKSKHYSRIIPNICTTNYKLNTYNNLNNKIKPNNAHNLHNHSSRYNSTVAAAQTSQTNNVSKFQRAVSKIRDIPVENYLFYAGNGSQLLAFACTDILTLRLLSISCGLFFIGFHYRNRYLSGILWGCAFALINGIMIVQLLFKKLPIEFSAEELNLYDHVFFPQNISTYEFKQIMNISNKNHLPEKNEDYTFCHEGKELNKLYLILNGEMAVKNEGALITKLKASMSEGELVWVGEMSLFNNETPNATVSLLKNKESNKYSEVEYICWDKEILKKYLNDGIIDKVKFERVVSSSTKKKLDDTNKSLQNLKDSFLKDLLYIYQIEDENKKRIYIQEW